MNTVNIHEAKTQLSRLVDQAAKGKSFVIAKAGKVKDKVNYPTSANYGRYGAPGGAPYIRQKMTDVGHRPDGLLPSLNGRE